MIDVLVTGAAGKMGSLSAATLAAADLAAPPNRTSGHGNTRAASARNRSVTSFTGRV